MYYIAICDDEKGFAAQMQENLAHYADAKGLQFHFQIYYDGQELLEHYRAETDLIFMDIKMEKMDGLKTAEQIRRRDREVGIVFLTSMAEHVWRGYEFGAFNYLMKPLKYERLAMELDRFFAVYSGKEQKFLIVTNDKGKFKIQYKSIRYIEVEKRSVLVHYEDTSQIMHKSMKETALMFENEAAFARCHASFLVNLAYITSVENMAAVLSTGERIPVSHPKQKEFMLKLAEYLGNRM